MMIWRVCKKLKLKDETKVVMLIPLYGFQYGEFGVISNPFNSESFLINALIRLSLVL